MNDILKCNQRKVKLIIVFFIVFIGLSYFNLSTNMIKAQAQSKNEIFNYEILNH